MPPEKTDKELADDFLNFFIGKINKIRSDLEHYPLYQLEDKIQQRFRKFDGLSQAAVRTLVLKAKPTNCTSDPVPTKLLKGHIDTLLSIITRIVNLSLSNGQFAEYWKVSIIKLLVKRKDWNAS